MQFVNHTTCSFLKGKRQHRMTQGTEPRGKKLAREFPGKYEMLEIGLIDRVWMGSKQAGDLVGHELGFTFKFMIV